MKNNVIRTFVFVLSFALVSISAVAQRNAPRDPNPFLNRDYWEKQPSIGAIEATIKEGHSVTQSNRGGFDATTYAIFEGNPLKTIDFLIAQGNDINKRTHDSRTYIFWAASNGNVALVKHLIGKGAKLDLVDSHGYGPISFTAASGQEDTAIYDAFIDGGADVKKEKDHHGKNALLVATGRAKSMKIIDYFINKGLAINSTDEHGNGIFHYAAQGGNIDILKQLVARGVSTKKNETTNENAIFFASKVGRGGGNGIEVFQYLEGIGISPNIVTKEGETPIHNLAGGSSDTKLFEYFIAKGVDINAQDEKGNTALLNSVPRNKFETISYIAEKTKNINHTNKKGQSALTLAVQNNSAEVVNFLISKGAKIDVLDTSGNNLAFYLFDTRGIPKDFDAKVQALEKAGFDFKDSQANKSTIWHLAVSKNNLDLLKKVSDFGADINAKDNQGNTPLHNAAMKTRNTKILKFLIANGADVKSTTEFGETALDLAKENELLAKSNSSLDFLN
ncbi:ankyrin repeat domain-containing protein [Aurantibacter sp.]|uniref:ankyrin repeat domain-containing protein n=1 Tax=Aurantibacter sp. TaxID=2807103 RepID=UPI0032642FCF